MTRSVCRTEGADSATFSQVAGPDVWEPWRLYSERTRWLSLGILFLCGATAYIDRGIVSIILEPVKAEFRTSDTMLGMLTGFSFATCFATLGIPVSRFIDRANRPLVVAASVAIFSSSTAICGIVFSFWQLLLARVGVGAGEAGVLPSAQSLIADYFPPARRARANSLYVTCGIFGSVLGLTVGTRIVQGYGWRTLLVVSGAPGLLIAAASLAILPEPRHKLSFATPGDQESLRNACKALLGKRSYTRLLIALILYYLLAFGPLSFLVSFLVRVHHVTLAQAGTLTAVVNGIAATLGSLSGGVLTDRLVARDVAWLTRLPGIGFLCCGPLFMAGFSAPTTLLAITFVGLGYLVLWAIYPAILNTIHAICGSQRRATAFALAFFFANLIGLGAGSLLTGFLSDGFAKYFGAAAGLQISMVLMMTFAMPTGVILWRTTRWLHNDLEA